jgi:hypothetical protein
VAPRRRGSWLLDHLWPPPPDELSDVLETDPRKVFRTARSHGWTVSEASNLAAYLCGLRIVADGRALRWTMPQVMACRFWAWVVQEKRMKP